MLLDDKDLISKAAEGDIEAFEEIYKHLSSFVYNTALRVCMNAEDAKEVTQDVFINIHGRLREFRFESSLRTWAYRITVNTAINALKKNKRSNLGASSFDEAMHEPTQDPEVHQQGEKEELQQHVELILAKLPPEMRSCVVLRNIEDLSYEEISKVLGVNINTVRTRLKRAREKMMVIAKKVTYE